LVANYIADLNARRLATLILVVFVVGGVLCTASRGSLLALFGAALVTTAVFALRRGNRGFAAGLLAVMVAGVALMSWAGQTEFVRSRLSLLLDQSQYDQGRIPNWLDALRVVPHFALAGSGLGTYPFVYEQFQQRYVGDTVHRHAENQYLQTLVEGGLIAELLLWITIALTTLAIVRLFRAGGPMNLALAVAGTFGLTSQMIGGLFDFGLYIPSNGMLMAALCGIVVGRSALLSVWPAEALDALDHPLSGNRYVVSPTADPPAVAHCLEDDRWTVMGATRSRRSRDSRAVSLAVARSLAMGLTVPSALVTLLIGFLMVGCLFGSIEMRRGARIEAATRQTNFERLTATKSPQEMLRAAAPLIAALPQRWDDALAHQHLALLHVLQYQCETYRQLAFQQSQTEIRPSTATVGGDAGRMRPPAWTVNEVQQRDPELWSRASTQQLHRTLAQLTQEGNEQLARQLQQSDAVQQFLVPAVRHFLAARQYAPTIARVHYRLAELSSVAPELGDEQAHLQRAQLLSPGDATIWYRSGLLELDAGRLDEACRCWRQSLLLTRRHLAEIVAAAQGRLTIRQLLDLVLPRQADLLLQVAREFFGTEDREAMRQIVLRRANQELQDTHLPPAQMAYTQAAILNLMGRKQEAIEFYSEAISRQSNNLDWRYEFARLLMELERFDQAHEHVEYLHNARPKSETYQRLLSEFNARRWRVGIPP
jgi:tetratricopeptide (TPR) repeat protein